ncbi:MAG: carboxypeptidase regulatory-like domain-containing protein, partial [Acidobacteriota bacterium]
MRRTAWVVVCLALVLTAVGAMAQAPLAGAGETQVFYPHGVAVSPPLRDLPPATEMLAPAGNREIPNPALPKGAMTAAPSSEEGDPAVQSSHGMYAMPGTVAEFAGIGNLAGVAPPDTEGDIGPDHYMQWVNLHLAVWSINRGTIPYTATQVVAPIAGSTLWSSLGGPCAANNDGDPIVLWDRFRSRWVISQFSLPDPYYVAIAVSQTADPTGAWYLYCYEYDATNMNDYPKFGIWPDGYYMTVNQFANMSSWAGAGVCVFEADQMITGSPTARMLKVNLGAVDLNFGGQLPAHFEGMTNPPAGSPCYIMQVDDSSWIPPNDALRIWKATTNWSTGTLTLGVAGQPDLILPTNNWDILCSGTRNCIPQPGTTQAVDAIADRLMYRLQYRNFGSYESMVVNHTVNAGSSRAGVRWYELRKDSTQPDWYIYQQGTFAPADTYHRWMGSAAQDHMGNLAVGYSVSDASTMYPSIYYAGRLASDPLGELTQGEALMYLGAASQTGVNRWGDYSSMSIDPYDDCTFWYTTEYSTGSWDWETRIGAFKYGTCSVGPTGTLAGTVTDSATTLPLAGATVTATNGIVTVNTNTAADGTYSMTLPVSPPNFDVGAARYGYVPDAATGLVITDGMTTVQDFSLAPAPSHVVSGVVTDSSTNWPLYAEITVTAPGFPTATLFTDPVTGAYSITLVDGMAYTFAVSAWVSGYDPGGAVVGPFSTDVTQDFPLDANLTDCNAPGYHPDYVWMEDFEADNGAFTVSGTSTWAWGAPTSGPGEAHSGANAWATNLSGNYNNSEDGYITSPAIDLSAYAGQVPVVEWWQYLNSESGYDYGSMEVTNNGSTWTRVYGEFSGAVDTSWAKHTVVLDATYATAAFQIRFRFRSDSSVTYAGWYIDDVSLSYSNAPPVSVGCLSPEWGGLVVGNVYDANTNNPLNGATVTSVDLGTATTTLPTPDDPNVDDGFYCMYATPCEGPCGFTATRTGYGPDTESVTVLDYDAVRLDFYLPAGRLEASPTPIEVTVSPSAPTTSMTMTLSETGGSDATFDIRERDGHVLAPARRFSVKGQEMLSRKMEKKWEAGKEGTSIGRAPAIDFKGEKKPGTETMKPVAALLGESAYGCNIYPGSNLVQWPDIDIPGTWTDLGSYGAYSFFGGDFLNGDTTTMYAVDYDTNQLCAIDTATHTVTVIGPCTPNGSEAWTGLTGSNDGTLYGASTDITRSTLYTIDPATGAATVVGQITNAPGIIDIAINVAGEMYGVDIVSDALVYIDTATGAGTVVGGLGVNANYTQGMDFEDISGTLYWAAYTSSGELRTIDTATGASTLVGAFPGGAEVDCLAFTTFGSGDVPWISETPTTGTVTANGTQAITVDFDATGLTPGDYLATLLV